MRKQNKKRADSIVEVARKQVGYRAQPERRAAFQPKIYSGKPWNGMYVDRVLREAFGGEPEVSFYSTVTALGYYTQKNRLYHKRVAPGDIVFYNFATDPMQPFEQPHVGIVVETRPDGSFRVVEGETSTGMPQGSQVADGVFVRTRYRTDILGTVRPQPRIVPTVNGEPATVKMSYFESNGKTVARAVETVQRALNRVRPAWTFNRGKRDGVFKSAFGRYARETGAVENRGEITERVLHTLGDETGLTVEP